MTNLRLLWLASMVASVVVLRAGCQRTEPSEGSPPSGSAVASNDLPSELPLVAVWMDSAGLKLETEAPFLRIAIWEDGQTLFARDPAQWGHDLRVGHISENRIKRLKKALAESGIFALKGHCYLVPDAPVICVLAHVDGRKQLLYWDEREMPGYGINVDPQPHHRDFIRTWKKVNRLALSALPETSTPFEGRFPKAPESWFVEKAIQSE